MEVLHGSWSQADYGSKPMRTVDYTDERGRKYRVKLPEGITDEQAELGIPIGPPDVVDYLEIPEPFATALHNQLFMRGLFTAKDIRASKNALQGAFMAAINADAARVYEAYVSLEKGTAIVDNEEEVRPNSRGG